MAAVVGISSKLGVGAKDADNNFPVIRKTPFVNRFLSLLRFSISENGVEEDELDEIRNRIAPENRHMMHLILLASLKDGEIQRAFREEDEIFASLSILLEEDMGSLSKQLYWKIVVGLQLLEECFCMIMANPQMSIMTETAASLTAKIVEDGRSRNLSKDTLETVMSILTKLARFKEPRLEEIYLKCLKDLARFAPEVVKDEFEKTVLVFRVMGVAILQPDDLLENNEISKLFQGWEFDSSSNSHIQEGVKLFGMLFNTNVSDILRGCAFNKTVLMVLEILLETEVPKSEDTSLLQEITVNSQNLTRRSYLGGCAYLLNLIIQKYTVDMQDLPKLESSIKYWMESKPKMKEDEFMTEVPDFALMCREILAHGGLGIYNREWLLKFLTFSSEQIVSDEGCEIASTFIVEAEFEIVEKYFEKVSDCSSDFLDDTKRTHILQTLIESIRNQKMKTQDLVKVLFRNGINSKLRTTNLHSQLTSLTSQVATIEFEKDSDIEAQHQQAVMTVCLQDPHKVISKLLEYSCRTQHFKALEFTTHFFRLPFCKDETDSQENQTEEDEQLPSFLITDCFQGILKYLPEYPDSIYESLSNAFANLISRNIISESEIFVVLKYEILKLLRRTTVSLVRVVGLVALLDNFSTKVVNCDRLKTDKALYELAVEIYSFALRLSRFFYLYTNKTTFSHAMQIRNKLCNILKHFKDCQVNIQKDIDPEMCKFDAKSLADVGFLYIRCENVRPMINQSLESYTDLKDELTLLNLSESFEYALHWTRNSCENEWGSLIEFLFDIMFTKCTKLKGFSKVQWLNQLLLLAYAGSLQLNFPEMFLHFLKFYGKVIEVLRKKGEFADNDWNGLMHTVFTLCFSMSTSIAEKKKPFKDTAGLHQSLSFLLHMVEEFGKSGVSHPKGPELMLKMDKLQNLDGMCESVRWLISARLKVL